MKYKLIKTYPGSENLNTILNVDRTDNTVYTINGWLELSKYPEFWQPVIEKQKLFTTEDGVDIFKGDKVYYVETDDEPENSFKVNEYTIQYPGRFTSDSSLHSFSTKEKAEEYILMNKPCLSINDIKNTFPRIFDGEKELIKLVKSKIQQSV